MNRNFDQVSRNNYRHWCRKGKYLQVTDSIDLRYARRFRRYSRRFSLAGLPVAADIYGTLRWGQPAYLPLKTRIGTSIGIDALRSDKKQVAACDNQHMQAFSQSMAGRALQFSLPTKRERADWDEIHRRRKDHC